ncbi:hypothetical protein BJV74DRAFT_844156 [Russula compacta]|nr:hypothetical protein BJV74DRAFT_844156 [Russula compacta]
MSAWGRSSRSGRQRVLGSGKQQALLYITRKLRRRHRALLGATPADWAPGAVTALNADSALARASAIDFKRDCDAMEVHPLEISFCDRCRVFFASRDSLVWHCKNRPRVYLDVSLAQAEVKRRETTRVHKEFQERLEGCLKSGGDIGLPFVQIIKM